MSYGVYLAEITNMSLEDNRLQVKVLPQMKDIEEELCPIWPCFFKNEFFIPNKGEMVWVICDNEFSTGYVLGPANSNSYRDVGFQSESLSSTLRNIMNESLKEEEAKSFNFANIKVDYWNSDTIHFIERSTGNRIIAYSNGNFYIFKSDEFLLKLGKTVIKVIDGEISLTSGTFKVACPDISLGMEPQGNVMIAPSNGNAVSLVSECVKA